MSSKRSTDTNKNSSSTLAEEQLNDSKRQKRPETLESLCSKLSHLLLPHTVEKDVNKKITIVKTFKEILLQFGSQTARAKIIIEFTNRDMLSLIVNFMATICTSKSGAAELIVTLLMIINNAVASTEDDDGSFVRLMGTTETKKLFLLLVEYLNSEFYIRDNATAEERVSIQTIPFQALWVMNNLCLSKNNIYARTASKWGAINAIWKHLSGDVHLGLTMEKLCLERAVSLLSSILSTPEPVQDNDTVLLLDMAKDVFLLSSNSSKSVKNSIATETDWKIASCRIIVCLNNNSRDAFVLQQAIHTGLAAIILHTMVQYQINHDLKLYCMKAMKSFAASALCYDRLHELTFVVGLLSELRLLLGSSNIMKYPILGEACSCIASLWTNSYHLAYHTVALIDGASIEKHDIAEMFGTEKVEDVNDKECGVKTATMAVDNCVVEDTDERSDGMHTVVLPDATTTVLICEDNDAVMRDTMRLESTEFANGECDTSATGVVYAVTTVTTAVMNDVDSNIDERAVVVSASGANTNATMEDMVIVVEQNISLKSGMFDRNEFVNDVNMEQDDIDAVSVIDEERDVVVLRKAIVRDLKCMMNFLTEISSGASGTADQRVEAFQMLSVLLRHASVRFELYDMLPYLDRMVQLFPLLLSVYTSLGEKGPIVVTHWLESIGSMVEQLHAAQDLELVERVKTILYKRNMLRGEMEKRQLEHLFEGIDSTVIDMYNMRMKVAFE